MADIILRDIDDSTIDKLAKLAQARERSVEEQAKAMLSQAVDRRTIARQDRRASAERIAAMTPKGILQTDSTILVREDRDR